MAQITIGIVNWNTKDYLDHLLDSIYKSVCHLQFNIVVVDNGSTDGSVQMLANKHPRVKLIENKINRGFTAACNQIINKLKTDYILLINTDVVVLPDCIDTLYNFMVEKKETAACGPQLLSKDGKIQPSARKFHGLGTILAEVMLPSKLIIFLMRSFNPWNSLREVEYVSGAFIMISKNAIDQIGLFDETFFLYVQEIDWCYRAAKAGWKIYYVPSAKAIHYEGVSTRPITAEAFSLLVKERHQFILKHFGRPKANFLARLLPYAVRFKSFMLIFVLWFNHSYRNKKYVLRNMYKMWCTLGNTVHDGYDNNFNWRTHKPTN